MRILIAEDSAVDSILLRNMVKRTGHDAIVVGDGEAALQALKDHPEIGMALVDICLPGMTGIELVRTIRQDPLTADMPVLFASGVSESETVLQAAALRPDGYILKPFTEPSLVLRRIQQAEKRVKPVVLDEATVKQHTGLGPAGIRELRSQLQERLSQSLTEEGPTPDQALAIRGLAHQLGAQRLLSAMDGQDPGGWGTGGWVRREAQAVLNCLEECAA